MDINQGVCILLLDLSIVSCCGVMNRKTNCAILRGICAHCVVLVVETESMEVSISSRMFI